MYFIVLSLVTSSLIILVITTLLYLAFILELVNYIKCINKFSDLKNYKPSYWVDFYFVPLENIGMSLPKDEKYLKFEPVKKVVRKIKFIRKSYIFIVIYFLISVLLNEFWCKVF